MSKNQTLRALVTERLAAAAEDIFVLFERWTAEYEEELCRYKEENQRKQQLLDKVLSPRIELVRGNYQIPSTSPGLDQEIPESPGIKEEPEEQSVKQEEEQLPVSVPESSAVCVKTEDSSLLQQRQTEHREETQGEDISSEPHFHSETETGHTAHSSDADNDDHWEPFSCAAEQMETEADGDHYNQVQSRDRSIELSSLNKSAPETTVHNEDLSGADGKKHQCSVSRKQNLISHKRVHTGEKPFSCSICQKTFGQQSHLDLHERRHTGQKSFSCRFCKKTFTQKCNLNVHIRIHTGEKPYSCSFCKKTFAQKTSLDVHVRTHTREKPYSCSICKKTFTRNNSLDVHNRTHTGEKPYSCPICKKTFRQQGHLDTHVRTHAGERPFRCSICEKTFTAKASLDRHSRAHTGEKSVSCGTVSRGAVSHRSPSVNTPQYSSLQGEMSQHKPE